MEELKEENPAESGDPELDQKRREMDAIIRNRYRETPAQKLEYASWISKQIFKTDQDREIFNLLPMSDTEKMIMVKELIEEGKLNIV